MRKFIVFALVATLFGCTQSKPVFSRFVDKEWGTVGLLPGWIIESEDGQNIALRSKDEVFLKVFITAVDKPSDIQGFVKSQMELTGRVFDSVRESTINDQKVTSYKATAQHGKKILEEELYLFDIGEKILAVNGSTPSESKSKNQVQQTIESVTIKGGK
jgi:hypothetical protein